MCEKVREKMNKKNITDIWFSDSFPVRVKESVKRGV